ncbi:two-component sensor histidine kinase [Streptomyces sp. NWU339]|uniref:sensor histidine kinase n=1 Tax=Streptomyces sp. NWU339 TaxID=2185284 RepID=UPI000D68208E|nr:histidine kinase [Streptomyces sp. NWU339]PWI06602.1 two-component sensor histidine kinase [Streptomyces sp. NWU339]
MRSRRDWVVDIAFFLFAVIFSVVTADSVHLDESMSGGEQIADQVAGGLACALVFLRRRWPVHLAVALMLAGTYFHHLTGAMLVALFTVAVHRKRRVTSCVAAVVLVQFLLFLAQGPDAESEAAGSALTYFALVAGAIGWGLYVRYRRALIASLEERTAQAAEEARRQAREEIAREMHDVLAHRLSLLSVHAGALEFNPSAPASDIQRAAEVIRDSAHQALQDLREVIGVLRAPTAGRDGAEGRPQPTLADVERLVAESHEAGIGVTYHQEAKNADTLPAVIGRTAYRIVQEGLTNVRKHAADTEITVTVSGRPGEGLTVVVANPLPGSPGTAIPGAGQGLIGLGERAELAGGRLEHGPRDGSFVLRAWLPWDGAKAVDR